MPYAYNPERVILRCGYCRTRKASGVALALHEIACKKKNLCHCGAYHYPHHKGTAACVHAPEGMISDAIRQGATEEQVAWLRLSLKNDCPF